MLRQLEPAQHNPRRSKKQTRRDSEENPEVRRMASVRKARKMSRRQVDGIDASAGGDGAAASPAGGKTSNNNRLAPPNGQGPTARILTVSAHFKNSLADLMTKLMSAQPRFVRCIKPNRRQTPGNYDEQYVSQQLAYTGVLETVRIRRDGYAVRLDFVEFVRRYQVRLCWVYVCRVF